MKYEIIISKATRMKATGALKTINDKWKTIPRRGTKEFRQYSADLTRAQKILQEA
jgi:hypothetical protein